MTWKCQQQVVKPQVSQQRRKKKKKKAFLSMSFITAIQHSYCSRGPGQTCLLSRARGKHRNIHKAHTAGNWLAGGIWRRWVFADNAKAIVTAADCKPSVVNSGPNRELRKRRGEVRKALGELCQAQNNPLLKCAVKILWCSRNGHNSTRTLWRSARRYR